MKKDKKPVPGPAYEHAKTCSSCALAQFGKSEHWNGGKKQMGMCFVVTGRPPERPVFPKEVTRYYLYETRGYDIRLDDLVSWRSAYERGKGHSYSSVKTYPSLKEYLELIKKALSETILGYYQDSAASSRKGQAEAQAVYDSGKYTLVNGIMSIPHPSGSRNCTISYYLPEKYQKQADKDERALASFLEMLATRAWVKPCTAYYTACDLYHQWWQQNWPNVRLAHRNVTCSAWTEGGAQRDTYAKSIVAGNRTLHDKEH